MHPKIQPNRNRILSHVMKYKRIKRKKEDNRGGKMEGRKEGRKKGRKKERNMA